MALERPHVAVTCHSVSTGWQGGMRGGGTPRPGGFHLLCTFLALEAARCSFIARWSFF